MTAMRTTEFAARADQPEVTEPQISRPFRTVTLRQRNRHGYTIHTVHHYASSVDVERRLGRYLGYTEIDLG